jgi:hypothetical protein
VKFTNVVAERESAVVDEPPQRDALIASVTDRCRKRGLIENALDLDLAALEEILHHRPRLRASHLLLLVAGRVRDVQLDTEQRADVRERNLYLGSEASALKK